MRECVGRIECLKAKERMAGRDKFVLSDFSGILHVSYLKIPFRKSTTEKKGRKRVRKTKNQTSIVILFNFNK